MNIKEYNKELLEKTIALCKNMNTKKATFDTATGLYGDSLEAPAKSLIPFLPSWVGKIPREEVKTGNSHPYKRILSLARAGKATASEGTRGGGVTATTDSKTVNFGIISSGLFDVTYEEEKASQGFDDALAKATTYALLFGRRLETAHILGGKVTALSGAGATIAAANEASVASDIAAATYYVNVKALTAPAMQKAILANVCILPGKDTYHTVSGIDAVIDQTDGYSIEGTQASAAVTANQGLKITWTAVPGAVGYAVFVGTTTGIENLKCQGIVGQTYITLNHISTGGSAGISGDNSADANDFDGIIPLLVTGGGYTKNAGAGLSSAVGNGIPEIDEMLASCYARSLGIDEGFLVMGTQDRAQVTRKLGQGASNSLYRININASEDNNYIGGAFADYYIHPISGKRIPIVTDPNLYAGTILWIPTTVPYPMAELESTMKMWLSYDWANFAYAITSPKREYENRMRGGLAMYIPPAFGMLYNIYNA